MDKRKRNNIKIILPIIFSVIDSVAIFFFLLLLSATLDLESQTGVGVAIGLIFIIVLTALFGIAVIVFFILSAIFWARFIVAKRKERRTIVAEVKPIEEEQANEKEVSNE